MLAVIHARGQVGTLRPVERELEFAYTPAWLARRDAFALSPRLPLREAPWQGEEVLVFFANLLPEGAILDTLVQLRRLPRGNVYRLLEAFGRECAGAFEIVPASMLVGKKREPKYRRYPAKELARDLEQMRDRVPLLESHGALRLSLAGAQNKIPVRYDGGELWLPENGAPSTHILKPALQPQKSFPDSVINEAFCLQSAAAVGLNVAKASVLSDPEPVLLIERYDRLIDGKKIERLHQLDMCQLAGVLPDQKYEADGGPGLVDCFGIIDRHSALPAVDRLRLIDLTIFNFLIGNADAHAKNLSMLYGIDGTLRLAPAYDLLALGYWPALDGAMAMSIGGEKRPPWVMARHWQRFCEGAGLNEVQLRRRARELSESAVAKCHDTLAALGAGAKFRAHMTTTLETRSAWIEQRLGTTSGNKS